MKTAAFAALSMLVVFVAAASGATVAGRIVFAANNAPSLSGHIYVSRGGGFVDLSARTPGLDSTPAVSPDGTHVAFTSYRGGHTAVYVMGIDGSHVRRASPFLGTGGMNGNVVIHSITWRPDSRLFAVAAYRRDPDREAVYAATVSGGWRVLVPPGGSPSAVSGWTGDGRLFLYVSADTGGVEGVDSAGRTRFDVPGESLAASAAGEIAVQRDSETWILYSPAGRQLARLPNTATVVWSPSGARFASMSTAGVLRVRTPSGRVVASGRFRHAQVVGWLGDAKIRLDGGNGIYGISAATAKRVALPAAFRQYTLVTRGPRVAALLYPPSFTPGNVVRLVVGRAGGAVRDVATYPVCADLAPVSDLQLFGSSGVAYATSCVAPAADVYSVSPDGSDLQRLTTSPYDDAQPAVSPDGTTIAYVRKDNEVHCPGCTETLWAMSADGTGAHSFPNSSSDDLPYDDDPSFSPDGKTILFVRSGPDATGLFTVPVQGGAVRDLKVSGSGAVWGPSEIAYDAWPSGKPSTMSPDGTRRAIARGAGSGGAAAWSPDGRLAYLQTDAQGRLSILLSAAGKRIALPHLTSVTIGGLAWSPDGTRLAFVATDASGESDVWMIRADGTQLVRVTHGLGAVTSVAWR